MHRPPGGAFDKMDRVPHTGPYLSSVAGVRTRIQMDGEPDVTHRATKIFLTTLVLIT